MERGEKSNADRGAGGFAGIDASAIRFNGVPGRLPAGRQVTPYDCRIRLSWQFIFYRFVTSYTPYVFCFHFCFNHML